MDAVLLYSALALGAAFNSACLSIQPPGLTQAQFWIVKWSHSECTMCPLVLFGKSKYVMLVNKFNQYKSVKTSHTRCLQFMNLVEIEERNHGVAVVFAVVVGIPKDGTDEKVGADSAGVEETVGFLGDLAVSML